MLKLQEQAMDIHKLIITQFAQTAVDANDNV